MSISAPLTKSASDYPKKTVAIWLGTVLVVALLERLLLWLSYRPVPYGDSPSYRRLAEAVLNGFHGYDGTRTPGYPIFMALIGPDQRIFLVQMGLGIGITLILFYLGWQLTRRTWFAGLAALLYSLSLGQLFFEANLLTETLTTFFIALMLAGMCYALTHLEKAPIWLAFLLGVSSSLALITRPLFIHLPFWCLLFLAFQRSGAKTSLNWRRVVVFLLPVVLIVGSWLGFIHSRYHMWSLTTMTGYHLVQHTGNFFEFTPDKYAVIRDIYLQSRAAHIAEYGTQTSTIWDAIPALQKATGLSFYDLSRTLTRISVQLILEHPGLYLQNVLKGWWLFWRAPVYWSPEALRWPSIVPALQAIILAQRVCLVGANLVFIVFSIPALFIRRLMPDRKGLQALLWVLVGTVWIASVLQTLLDHGDNPRFLVPLQSFVALWVLWFGFKILQEIKKAKRVRG